MNSLLYAKSIRNKSNRKSAQVADPSPSGDQQKQQEQKQTKPETEEAKQQQVEIVRPTPAGSKEQVEYELSIDLKQTKALFETPTREEQALPTATRRSSTRVQQRRRSSSATSSTRSASPARSNRSSSAHSTRSRDSSEMAEVVRPPPAGTKEVVEVQPSLSISAARSMFESRKDETSKIDVDFTSPRRRQLKSGWATNANKDDETKVVKEGAFVENNGVVRPPSAGTKETPDYQLESNALKARAAIFQQGKGNEYKPRNTIKKEENKIAEIVNRKEEGENDADNDDIVPSIDQKAARSVFENSNEQSKNVDVPRTVNDVVRASNMNAAKGVFSGAAQPAANNSEEEKSSGSSSSDEEEEKEEEKQEEAAPVPAAEEVKSVEPQQQSFDLAPITEPVATQEPQGFDLAPITEPVATQEPQGFDLAPIVEPVAVQEPQGFDLAPIVEPAAEEKDSGSQFSSESKTKVVAAAEKLKLIENYKKLPKMSQREAAKALGISRGFMKLILKTEAQIRREALEQAEAANDDLVSAGDEQVEQGASEDKGNKVMESGDIFASPAIAPDFNLDAGFAGSNPDPFSSQQQNDLDIFAASPPPNTPASRDHPPPAAADPFAAFSTSPDPFAANPSQASQPAAGGDPFDIFGGMGQAAPMAPAAAPEGSNMAAGAAKDPFDLFG